MAASERAGGEFAESKVLLDKYDHKHCLIQWKVKIYPFEYSQGVSRDLLIPFQVLAERWNATTWVQFVWKNEQLLNVHYTCNHLHVLSRRTRVRRRLCGLHATSQRTFFTTASVHRIFQKSLIHQFTSQLNVNYSKQVLNLKVGFQTFESLARFVEPLFKGNRTQRTQVLST